MIPSTANVGEDVENDQVNLLLTDIAVTAVKNILCGGREEGYSNNWIGTSALDPWSVVAEGSKTEVNAWRVPKKLGPLNF